MERFTLPDDVVDEMCERLGTPLPRDLGEVDDLYRQWCATVPFDTIAKARSRVEGRTPPGADPLEFCRRWLDTGVGGLCWGHVGAMAAILACAGVHCRVGVDRLLTDEFVDFHAFLVVEDGDRLLACDPVHYSGRALPLEPGASGGHHDYRSGFNQIDGRLGHWFVHPGTPEVTKQYVVLSTDLDVADVRAFCLVSQHQGMAGRSLYHRRAAPEAFVAARPSDDGSMLAVSRYADGQVAETSFTSPAEALAHLGYPPGAVAHAAQAGLVDLVPGARVPFSR